MRHFRVISGGLRRKRWLRKRDLRFAARTFATASILAIGLMALPWPPLLVLNPYGQMPTIGDTAVRSFEVVAASVSNHGLRVIDGDTVEVTTTGERIRLANIDTPEAGKGARCTAERRASDAATAETRRLIRSARELRVERTGEIDRYGRTIAYVRIDGRDLGAALVSSGHARRWTGRRMPWCNADGSLKP